MSAIVLAIRLLLPRPVGVADSYDGPRLMCHLRVDMHLPANAVRLKQFVTFRYDTTPRAACSVGHLGTITLPKSPYLSSQVLTLHAGRLVTRLLGFPGYLDLRAVGLVSCAMIGVAIGLLFWSLTCRARHRFLICALVLAVVADSAFIDFAVSPFSEIAAVTGILYVVPGILLLARRDARRLAGLLVTTAGGAFLVTAKTQDTVLVLPLAVVLAAFAVRLPLPLRPRPPGRGRALRGRLLPATCIGLLVTCALAVTTNSDSADAQITKANFVTASLLPTGTDAAADLRAIGAPPWLAALRGRPAWCIPTAMRAAIEKDAVSDLSAARDIAFVAARPSRALRIADTAAEAFYMPRPDATLCSVDTGVVTTPLLGNFSENEGGEPNAVDRRFTPVTTVLGVFRGLGATPLAVLWGLPALYAAFALRRRTDRGPATATLFLVGVAVLQFLVSAFGDGIDIAKHLNLAVFATAAAWAIAVAVLFQDRSRPTQPVPAPHRPRTAESAGARTSVPSSQ